MKKQLSFLLAASMVVGMLPVATAFAKTDNSVDRVLTVKDDGDINGTHLIIEEKAATPWSGTYKFELSLTNGVWKDRIKAEDSGTFWDVDSNGNLTSPINGLTYTVLDDYSVIVSMDTTQFPGGRVEVPLDAGADGAGDVTVTVDPYSSILTGGTWTIANASTGATKTTIAKITDATEGNNTMKNVVITETTPGSLKTSSNVKIKLAGEYEFVEGKVPKIQIVSGGNADGMVQGPINITPITHGSDGNFWTDAFEFTLPKPSTSEAYRIVISDIVLKTTDDIEAGDVAEFTISGAGATRETIEVAKFYDYGYTWKAEDKDVPVIYTGRVADKDDILKVKFKETVANSWISDRKTTLTLPEGVKFAELPSLTSGSVKNMSEGPTFEWSGDDHTKVTVHGEPTGKGKVEWEAEFRLSISPDFDGKDVEVTIDGSGVSNTATSATVATAEPPVKVETKVNEVKIDYRNVAIADITITEAYAGAMAKDATLKLQAEEMQFESGVDYEVVSGDIKIDKVSVSKKGADGGTLSIKVKSESAKEASSIKLSNIKLYLDRTLPTGEYDLFYLANDDGMKDADSTLGHDKSEVFFKNYSSNDSSTAWFDCDKVVAYKGFVNVITAPRDQDDSLFTTKVSVTIGSTEMKAGDQTIALDVPAYISADGFTMLPVRAVTEALSGSAIISWDNETRTITIIFGSRVISMKAGERTMTINGTPYAMSAKVEIKDDRAFVPLRDLGVALGVNESKINWDDATKTATLN